MYVPPVLPVRVTVARVDVDRRELDFRVVGRGEAPAKGGKSPAKSPQARARAGGKRGAGGKSASAKGPPRGKRKRRG